jgi:hypothetical protein
MRIILYLPFGNFTNPAKLAMAAIGIIGELSRKWNGKIISSSG